VAQNFQGLVNSPSEVGSELPAPYEDVLAPDVVQPLAHRTNRFLSHSLKCKKDALTALKAFDR